MKARPLFADYREAGGQLADAIARLDLPAAVVLGLGDEGLQVAEPVARHLGAPLGLYRVGLLRLPWRTSFAFGALTDDDHHYVDPEVVSDVSLGAREIAQLARELLPALRAAPRRPERPSMAGLPAVLVADALSTGYRALAAAAAARAAGAADVVVASPIAAEDAAVRVEAAARLVTLHVSLGPRFAAAEFYRRSAAAPEHPPAPPPRRPAARARSRRR